MSLVEGVVFGGGFMAAGLLLLVISRRTGDPLNAATLYSVAWGLNLFFCELLVYDELHLQLATLVVAVAAWLAFLVGFLGSSSIRWPMMKGSAAFNPALGKLALVTLMVLQVVAVLLELQQTAGIPTLQGILELPRRLMDARISGATIEARVPIWGLFRWSFTLYLPLAFLLYRKRSIGKWVLVFVASFALVTALLKLTRAPVLNVVTLCLVGSWIVSHDVGARRRASRRLLTIGAALAVFTFLFLGTEASLELRRVAQRSSWTRLLVPYVGGPLRAYEELLQHGDWWHSGRVYSLDAAEFLLFKLGLRSGYEGQIRPAADFGFRTNLYTYLDAFTLDAGVTGAILGSLALGALVGWFFYLARRSGSYWSLVMYCYVAYACFMVGANNEFVRFGLPLTAFMAWALGRILAITPSLQRDGRLLAQTGSSSS